MSALELHAMHHVALSVRDLDASAAWYERVFALERQFDEEADGRRAIVYRFAGGPLVLGLVEHDAGAAAGPFAPTVTGLDHVAFAVRTRAELDAWIEHLDDLGVAHSGAIAVPPGAICNFADPDGIALALF